MKRHLSFLLFLSVLTINAQKPDSSSVIFKMYEAERSFAEMSVSEGRKAAFATFLDEKALIYTSGWIRNGGEYWKGKAVTPFVLRWEPEYMIISASRDFGVSYGPWDLHDSRPGTGSLSSGYFLSVWKKNNAGDWRVILDAGSSAPAKTGHLHEFKYMSLSGGKTGKETIETRIPDYLINEGKENQLSFYSDSSILFIDGHSPSFSRDSLKLWLGKAKIFKLENLAEAISSSDDLGFTCGTINSSKTAHYVRIWRKDEKNEWKIIIEMLNL